MLYLLACDGSPYIPQSIEYRSKDELNGRLDTASILLGKWQFSKSISFDQARHIYGADLDGIGMSLTSKGQVEFGHGGHYQLKETFEVQLEEWKEKIRFPFLVQQTGGYLVKDGYLIQFIEGSWVKPQSDDTRLLLQLSPGFEKLFSPMKGASISTKIISLSPTVLKYEIGGKLGVVIIATKVLD